LELQRVLTLKKAIRLKKGKRFFIKSEALEKLDGEIEKYLRHRRSSLKKNAT
jgi:hypothetical protein